MSINEFIIAACGVISTYSLFKNKHVGYGYGMIVMLVVFIVASLLRK